MSAFETKLTTDIGRILGAVWSTRVGQVVPRSEDVALANGAVKLNAVVLYADLAHSTKLSRQFPNAVAAKIVRGYLSSMTQLVRNAGGEVRSFDGDRVMGVFVGGSKHTAAARCALKMNYTVQKILKPKAEAKFPSLKTKGFTIRHCVGVHSSEVLVVRGGVRGENDLVFVGSAANLAAKLSEIRRSPYCSYITHVVYNNLHESLKIGSDGRNMWTPVKCTLGDETWSCYRSNWWWSP